MLIRSGRLNRFIWGVVLVFFCSTLLTGCASFRRKFVRHSRDKEQKQDFMPVLVPVEYKRVEVPPLEAYRSHYAMVKAYFTDIYSTIGGKDSSGKREQYLLNQIVVHLEGMGAELTGARKTDIASVVVHLKDLLKEFDKPVAMRRYDMLNGSLRGIETDIRRKLKPDMVKEFIVP